MTDPRIPRGSDADVAEAGLDPEAAFAVPNEATARRLQLEARAQAEQNGAQAEQAGTPAGGAQARTVAPTPDETC